MYVTCKYKMSKASKMLILLLAVILKQRVMLIRSRDYIWK